MSARDKQIECEIPHLRRFARGLCRDAALADDLVQDCLERALSRWHLRRLGGSPRAWLFTILHNLYMSDRRRHRLAPVLVGTEVLEQISAGEPAADSRLHLNEVLARLEKLSEEQRATILLVAVEGFSYKEIATIMGVPIGTVMSRLSRGRAELRRRLGEPARPSLRRVK